MRSHIPGLTQLSDLTTMANVLCLVERIYWVVVEDAATTNAAVQRLLARYGRNHRLKFIYLSRPSQRTVVKSCE
jgi:hypothetical protein